MKTKVSLALAISCICVFAGCPITFCQQLNPVQGPAAAQTPPPVYKTKHYPIGLFASGVKTTLANGEKFKGPWKQITASPANATITDALHETPPQPNLAYAWDTVYGKGFYVAHVLGKSVVQAVLKGDHGSFLQVELALSRDAAIYRGNYWFQEGVAVDSKGNIYRYENRLPV
jgi:hypothetical protein